MAAAKKKQLRVLHSHDLPAEELGRAVVTTLIRVFGLWSDEATKLVKQHGLTLPHFDVLMCLRGGEGISQQDLSKRLMLTKGNICIMVQKMEAAGLIDRRSDPVDQRFHRLYMTDAGHRLVAKCHPGQRALGEQLLSGLDEGERRLLHDLLSRVEDSFSEIDR